MANYIHKLQDENAELLGTLAAMTREISAFRAHLASDKFRSTEDERRDWIATSDADTFALRLLALI